MKLLSLPTDTAIPFMRYRKIAIVISIILSLLSIGLFATVGMNYGIDFRGGTVVELRFKEAPQIADLRREIGSLNLGDVQIVEFGAPTDVLIRVEEQPGGEAAQQRAVILLREMFGEAADFRRVEVVGPRVSGELARAGAIAVIAALIAIMAYIWIRFEWHFAIGAVLTTLHDVILTIGLFSATQIEFNLSSIAAVLTIVGYSLNDTVVVYDRVRENLRRFKRLAMADLLDRSINQMLARTLMTSITTLLALIALFVFGGEVIRSFTFAMIWGVVVGTFSSIFIASPLLIILNLRPGRMGGGKADDASKDDAGEGDSGGDAPQEAPARA
ncbi:MAG: protein translocase subunit SecF [Pseudomonadota bacterium]